VSIRVAFRTDASVALGLGHLKRCMSLAHALRAIDVDVRFFWRHLGLDCAPLLVADQFAGVVAGEGVARDEEADARDFLAVTGAWRADAVIVDHYGLGAGWHRAVRAGSSARIVAISDQADRPLSIDLLVDHNFSKDHRAKYAGRIDPATPILGGPTYAMLGPAYAAAPRCGLRETVASIGIFMGGTDAANLSALAYRACRDGARFAGRIEVATTRGNPHLDDLNRLASGGGLTLVLDQPDLAAFFARHDLQIGAGGGATWERCCIGAPTLAMIAADNQREVIFPLQELGVLSVVNAIPPTSASISAPLGRLLSDPGLRHGLALAARQLVDGLGASRIAARIANP
jgi:UDP-2,4-diacetamido-2,4,6-trideoxy-beta-L-altropyranose hydrolase